MRKLQLLIFYSADLTETAAVFYTQSLQQEYIFYSNNFIETNSVL